MNILNILNYCLILFEITFSFNLHTDLKKTSIFSKLIYDYDYNNKLNHKKNININDCIINIDILKKNNIYFNKNQFFTHLNKNYFTKKTEKYFYHLAKEYPNTEFYGYFYNKDRLHSLILINHKYKEITVVFRGSQYSDEWLNNLIFWEREIPYHKKYKIHEGIFYMFSSNKIDNNIVFILNKLYNLYPNYRKIITGHSKATIESILLILKLNKDNNYEIFSYGNPQILNYELGEYLHKQTNIKIYNVMNDLDLITLLPINYQIGEEILLHNDYIEVKKHDHPYYVKNKILYKNLFLSIKNHDMNLYISNIFNSNKIFYYKKNKDLLK